MTEPRSNTSKPWMWAALLLVPVLFFALVEGGLRLFGVGGDLSLFAEVPGHERYLAPNPDVGRRYFHRTRVVPGPPHDAFLKEKPSDALRIVVQGGSSAAGFPYGHGTAFPRILEDRLRASLPGREVELINTAMDAVSSGVLRDLGPEIEVIAPDAVLIYAGHNEFFGALGTASTERLGSARWIVRLSLALDDLRIVQGLRALLTPSPPESVGGDPTLMEEMAASRAVEAGAPIRERTAEAFAKNLSALACGYRDADIPVYLATVVGNLRDQPPLLGLQPGAADDPAAWMDWVQHSQRRLADSDTSGAIQGMDEAIELHPADPGSRYIRAQLKDASRNHDGALTDFRAARDLDRLPFRAPSAINQVIRDVSQECEATLVDAEEVFARASSGDIVGSNLLLEHVHPNASGYALLAGAFYRAMADRLASDDSFRAVPASAAPIRATRLDSVLAVLHVRRLLGSWPFEQELPPMGRVEGNDLSLATEVLSGQLDWYAATARWGQRAEERGDLEDALAAALTLQQERPYLAEPLRIASGILERMGQIPAALAAGEQALRIEDTPEGRRSVGRLLTRSGRAEDGREMLRAAADDLGDDPGFLFDLAIAEFTSGETDAARETATRLKEIEPDYPAAQRLFQRLGIQ